jgi:hypothetical protein
MTIVRFSTFVIVGVFFRIIAGVLEYRLIHDGALEPWAIVATTISLGSLVNEATNRVRLSPFSILMVWRNWINLETSNLIWANVQRSRNLRPLRQWLEVVCSTTFTLPPVKKVLPAFEEPSDTLSAIPASRTARSVVIAHQNSHQLVMILLSAFSTNCLRTNIRFA